MSILCHFMLGFIALAILLIGAMIGYIRLSGHKLLAVQTASMQPVFSPGDAVIVTPLLPSQVRPGDIVSYRSLANPNVIVTHRLIRIDKQSGWLFTKGDRLVANDPAFPPRLFIGRAEAVMPKLGRLLGLCRQPVVLVILLYLPAAAIAYQELRRLQASFGSNSYSLHGYRA